MKYDINYRYLDLISRKITNVYSFCAWCLDQHIPNDWAKRVLSDAENLTEEKIDEVLSEFLKDFKEDMLETKVKV